MTTSLDTWRLLAGPALNGTAESLGAHVARLGAVPRDISSRELIGSLEASGLLGRGGAGFPVGRKWRAIAQRQEGRAVVVANGAEGEPASFKDRVLMAHRPHLVIDGAILAADAVGADEIVFYIGGEHTQAVAAMTAAVAARKADIGHRVRIARAPVGYVAGEATAVVNFINRKKALPTAVPPRVSERGVHSRPTLVQNVESLAYTALIARFGDLWYKSAGRGVTRGTALVTVSGAVREEGVREIEIGTPVGEVAIAAGGTESRIKAVLLGGYFGTWANAREAWWLPLDPVVMKSEGLAFGCGIIGLLANDLCGVSVTAQIIDYLAAESAGQCGPCVFGLRALGDATIRVANGTAQPDDLVQIEHITALAPGRGACHHPDGAAQMMASAMRVFGDEFVHHAQTGRCSVTGSLLGVR